MRILITKIVIGIVKNIVVASIVILSMGSTYAEENSVSNATSALPEGLPDGLPDHVAARLLIRTFGDGVKLPIWVSYALKLDTGEPAIDLSEFPAKSSLVYGAWVYALLTGDYEVSVKEVRDLGLVPFDVLEQHGIDESDIICRNTSRKKLSVMDFEDYGSDKWILRMKNNILMVFYEEYYFPYRINERDIALKIHPDELKMNDKFWLNRDTGELARVGSAVGDLKICYLTLCKGEGSKIFDKDPRVNWQVYMLRVSGCSSIRNRD